MLKHTHFWFWSTAIIILILGFIVYDPDKTLDVNVHDTYYVIAHSHLTVITAVFYFLSGLPYFIFKLLKRKPYRVFTVIHLAVMVGGFIAYYIISFIIRAMATKNEFPVFDNTAERLNMLAILSFFLVVLVQPLFLVNILIGTFRKQDNKASI